ncbi:hypothetical protein D1953_18540 [Peribacillus asahii]|uniref:YusW-like protein n=1 Tax=Peribacillus asahii TaxID=228899 RepID=A0A398B2Y8_9BACI|nr:YusW family protein [Peribacillus asahii]RID82156.1 hypothetical protein D1953_18540 [Peribacillus asahii]
MKNILKLVPFLAVIMLAGCGDQDEVNNPPAENNTQTNNNETAAFSFKEFELDVDYKGTNQDYEVEYDTLEGKIEASIEDSINDKNLHGDEAMKELTPLFDQLTFNQDTPQAEVIQEVLKVFNLKDDYQEFDLEVTFEDGMKKQYEQHQ